MVAIGFEHVKTSRMHGCMHYPIIKVDPAGVNYFCNSLLWTRQTLGERPRMIPEAEYVTLSGFSSHECRRNLTDLQETAQWQGGADIPRCILERLLGDLESS